MKRQAQLAPGVRARRPCHFQIEALPDNPFGGEIRPPVLFLGLKLLRASSEVSISKYRGSPGLSVASYPDLAHAVLPRIVPNDECEGPVKL